MKDYFTIKSIGKIVVIRENNKDNFYKEINGKLTILTVEEKETLEKILKPKIKTLLHSEMTKKIVETNPKLNAYKSNKAFHNMLDWIENLIPSQYRSNFYNNLSTLEIEYGIEYVSLEKNANSTLGGYDLKENKIIIYKHTLEEKKELSKNAPNSEEFYNKEINRIMLHELLHMASSCFNEDLNIKLTGFCNMLDVDSLNYGLTEGMTELLSMIGVQGTFELSSGYYIETLLTKQLCFIVGFDTMIDSYFGNLGTAKIKSELNKLKENEDLPEYLLTRFEHNHLMLNEYGDTEQTFLASTQHILIDYFKQKMKNEIQKGNKTKQEIEEIINYFESSLITPHILELRKYNVNNYIGLNESLIEFKNAKEYLFEMLNNLEETKVKMSQSVK